MFAYKTNSAEYLDYVAATLTREQIQNDPDLCILLENEYIKDNMEIAIRYNASKYGDYQDKYDFVEYLVCNGPELDADSLLHYRDKVYNDPVCLEIAYSYLSDVDNIKEIRDKKYKKTVDDCFSNPCFYLGRFSALMGSTGDYENTLSVFTIMANKLHDKANKSYALEKESLMKELQQAKISPEQYAEKIKELEDKIKEVDEKISTIPDSVIKPKPVDEEQERTWKEVLSSHFKGVIPTSISKGWLLMGKQILENNTEFTDEMFVNNTKCLWNATMVSDWMSYPLSKTIDLVSKANVNRHLGDCARMWSQVRNLRLFSYENSFGQITADQIVGKTNVDGTPQDIVNIPNPTPADALDTSSEWSSLHAFIGEDVSKIPDWHIGELSGVKSAQIGGKTVYIDVDGRAYTTDANNKLVQTSLSFENDSLAEE